MSSNAAFSFATIVCAWVLRVWLQRTNKKLARDKPEDGVYYAY